MEKQADTHLNNHENIYGQFCEKYGGSALISKKMVENGLTKFEKV